MRKCMYIALILIIFVILYTAIPFMSHLLINKKELTKDIHETWIVGHRGGADLAPENTLACINKGISAKADMIEIDIHLTKDGELVVCHDRTIDRTTNGSGKIANMTLAEIKKYHIMNKKGKITDEQIPTLNEVLESVNGKCSLLIEIKKNKNFYQGIESKLLATIKKCNAYEWITVQSFDDSVLETIHSLDKKIRLEKLVIFKFQWIPLIFDGTFTKFSLQKYHYISSFNFYYKAVTPTLIKKLHTHNKEIKMWTLKGPDKLKILPIDGIITDRPDLWTK